MSLEAADYKSLTGWRYSNASLKSQKINNMKGRRLIFAPNVKEGKRWKRKFTILRSDLRKKLTTQSFHSWQKIFWGANFLSWCRPALMYDCLNFLVAIPIWIDNITFRPFFQENVISFNLWISSKSNLCSFFLLYSKFKWMYDYLRAE